MSDCVHSIDEAEAVAGREGWCPFCLRDALEPFAAWRNPPYRWIPAIEAARAALGHLANRSEA